MNAGEIENIVKATIKAMDKYGGEVGFAESLNRFNLREEKLELWIYAYEEGGRSGIKALTETFQMDPKIAREALKQIRDFFSVSWPSWEYRVVRRYNSFTIRIKISEGSDYWELCQLRYTPFDQKWHLFWKKDNGKWCPYVSDLNIKDGLLWKTLYFVKLDNYGCFLDLA
ncbi:MAG: DUF3024 domain-containing protein [Bacillota bacterium]